MKIYALDSNIISYVLRGDEPVKKRFREEARKGNEFVMPPIVYFEIKRWLLERGAKNKEAEFNALCQVIPLGGLDRRVWNMAALLYVQTRKRGKPIDDADLIIASFCIVNDYILVTNNARHFAEIDGLELVNWKV